jgi:RNA polymerase sigma-70 factor (ECF subfamily)
MSAVACTFPTFGGWTLPRPDAPRSRRGRDTTPQPKLRQELPPQTGTATPHSLPGLEGPSKAREALDADATATVARCLRGDSLAWTELVRAQQGRVYALCYRFTGSSHDAEDLTQDVFLKMYSNLRSFNGARGSLGVWVTTLTRNHLVDHYRRSRLERASDSIDVGWDEADDAPRAPMSLVDARPGPHANALQREMEREVQNALASVSPELREAVILRDLQDMDYKEIAAILGVPEGTVKSRISRGRAELARILKRGRKQVS